MVRIASSFLSAAVALSAVVSALPTRRDDSALSTIDSTAIPSDNGSGSSGGSVQISTSTDSSSSAAYTTTADSSSSSAAYGSSSSSSAYGSSSSSSAYDSSSSAAYGSSSSSGYGSSSVQVISTTIVSSSGSSYTVPSYGSGSSGWQNQYNSCIETCFVSNPTPPTVVNLPPYNGQATMSDGSMSTSSNAYSSSSSNSYSSSSSSDSSSTTTSAEGSVSSSGATVHDVMVEPVQNAVRFVPAFLNAAAGDSVRFTFVNGQHSVVQSSALSPCNATAGGFNSGSKAPGATFTTTVNDTTPLFFFSDVGTDCQSGLFGGINAATGQENSTASVASLITQLSAANPDMATAVNLTSKLAVNTAGATWGAKIDTSDIPASLHTALAGSVIYTRAVIASNPEMWVNSSFKMTGEVVVPTDISQLFSVADQGGYPASSSSSSSASAALNDAIPSSTAATGGAGSLVSPRTAVVGVALLAAFFAF